MDDPTFGQPEADGKRDVLEGLMISLALQLSPHEHQCGARLRMLGEARASRLAVMDRAELARSSRLSQPSSSASWLDWAQDRWPSLTTP